MRAHPRRRAPGHHREPGRRDPGRAPAGRCRSPRPGTTWPPSTWPTCAGSTPSSATPATKITAAVRASGTSLTDIFGVGAVIAATVIGDVADITRFPTADRFASYNGTAPIEVSSGRRKIYRLSMRGNRRLNHAIHMAAVTQIAHKNSDGRAYYQRKLAEGKTPAEARRALKRKISNTIYARLLADARAQAAGPGGQPGNDTESSAAGSHPARQLFGQATPEPADSLRPPARASRSRQLGSSVRSASCVAPHSHSSATLFRGVQRAAGLRVVLCVHRPTLTAGTGRQLAWSDAYRRMLAPRWPPLSGLLMEPRRPPRMGRSRRGLRRAQHVTR